MLLREDDSAVFKDWLLPKLETISDADAEVLADYVIALVTANEPEESVRDNCLESLADFLQDNTTSFVDDVLEVLKTRGYAGGGKSGKPIPSIVGTSNSEYEPRAADTSLLNAPKGPAATRQHCLPDRPPAQSDALGVNTQQSSRKRKLVDRDTSETREAQDGNYNRTKQTGRRGPKNLRGAAAAFMPQNGFPGPAAMSDMFSMANLPPPPPGPMPFDMSNPMAFFAMMAALGTTMPGMPALPMMTPQNNGHARKGKCHDYHTKGFCAKGTMCLFEHDAPPDDVPEYDPDQPSLSTQSVPHPKRRQAVKEAKGGRPRAVFSLPGPTHDRTNTTLVVEQIPDDKFSEDTVREFFSQFGPIDDVKMHAYKRLAIVKFEDHASADQAYNSPTAVFENRFVKVYWHRQDAGTGESQGDTEAPDPSPLDLEEIARRTAEAQKLFEERRRRLEESNARSAEIDRQLQEKDAEIQDIKRQLSELAGDDENAALEAEFAHDLATLQKEAETLFAQKDSRPQRGAYRGRGRGRGRGAYRLPGGRTSVKRLDNRPRRLAVKGMEKGSKREEAVRQYLVNMPECTSIDPHPDLSDSLILTFMERYQAEIFADASRAIPDADGPLELAWVANDAFGVLKSTEAPAEASDAESEATVAAAVNLEEEEVEERQKQEEDADMDVAEDGDQWL